MIPIPIQLQIAPPWDQQVEQEPLLDAVQQALQAEGITEATLSLVIVGDDEMARLHETFSGEPGTTDVLTFPYEDDGVDEEMEGYLGDVIVCYEQAARQSVEEGHPVQAELMLLAVHGTLHLLGYDDQSDEERSHMWERQRHILEGLGLGHVAPRA